MLDGSSRKIIFIELHGCQVFLVNFILKLFKCFLPEYLYKSAELCRK